MARVAVLIHGYHLGAEAWENIAWGAPENGVFGVIPRGVALAAELDAERILWGTGASERGGVKEGAYMRRYALERAEDLGRFSARDTAAIRELLEKRSVVDESTQDTIGEVSAGLAFCLENGIERLYLVAAASHAPRSLKTALALLEEERFAPLRRRVFAAPADSRYAAGGVADVVIFEPPHRGDRPKVPFHETAKRMFPFLKNPDAALGLNKAWSALIDEWERKL